MLEHMHAACVLQGCGTDTCVLNACSIGHDFMHVCQVHVQPAGSKDQMGQGQSHQSCSSVEQGCKACCTALSFLWVQNAGLFMPLYDQSATAL